MEEQLLFRSLKGRTTPVEEAAVQAWRRESAENERTYHGLAEVLAAAAASEAPLETSPPSPLKLIHPAETRRSMSPVTAERFRVRPRWRLLAGAVSAAAAVVVANFALDDFGVQRPGGAEFEADEFVTGTAETATVTLRDGTVVRLGPQSRLWLSGRGRTREVSLRGRAFFAVAKDPARPFRIETTAGQVEVLGTRFEIRTADDDMRVVVVEGRVALAGRGGRAEVQAGEMRRIVAGTALPAVKIPDIASAVNWLGDFLAFQETPLGDAAREIEQLYGTRIEITDSTLAAQTITTWFADQPIEQVMTIFCMVAEARCIERDGRITVGPERRR